MPKISGTVDKIFVKKGTGKGGKSWKRYSLSIDGEWYNHGFKAPDCAEGDEVNIVYTTNDFGNEITNLTVSGDGEDSPKEAKKTSSKASDNTKQIHRQNALRHATYLSVAQGQFDLGHIVNVANDLCVYIETGELPAVEEPVAPKKKTGKTLTKEKHGFEDVEDDIEDIK